MRVFCAKISFMGGLKGYIQNSDIIKKSEPKFDSIMDAIKVFRAQKIESIIKRKLYILRSKTVSKKTGGL